MKILFLGDAVPGGQGNQNMLNQSLLYGLVRLYGMANVDTYFHYGNYFAQPEYLQGWPVHLGALSYRNCALPQRRRENQRVGNYDVTFVEYKWFWHAVERGMMTQDEFDSLARHLDPDQTILINSSDTERAMYLEHEFLWLKEPPRLTISRPGHRWFLDEMTVHITVPDEYIEYQLCRSGMRPPASQRIFASWSDNCPQRRAVMKALAKRFSGGGLRFGSAGGYKIPGTQGTVPIPQYYAELKGSGIGISCRGASPDTLRTWEILALGKLLITDDFGFPKYRHREHCLYYDSPKECVKQVEWVIANQEQAWQIAAAGSMLYRLEDTPEAQAYRIMQRAGYD